MSNDLWRFACNLYAAPGVRELCIELQDGHGVDVPLLLALAWLHARGVGIDDARAMLLEAACQPWQRDVVAPLRAARRALRPDQEAGRMLRLQGPVQAQLKDQVQALELHAERLQLDALAAVTASWQGDDRVPPLEVVLRRWAPHIAPTTRWQPLLRAAERQRAGADGPAG